MESGATTSSLPAGFFDNAREEAKIKGQKAPQQAKEEQLRYL